MAPHRAKKNNTITKEKAPTISKQTAELHSA